MGLSDWDEHCGEPSSNTQFTSLCDPFLGISGVCFVLLFFLSHSYKRRYAKREWEDKRTRGCKGVLYSAVFWEWRGLEAILDLFKTGSMEVLSQSGEGHMRPQFSLKAIDFKVYPGSRSHTPLSDAGTRK